ncbi:tandem-95 repeat protein [Pseudoalteromonas rhizosphaerae]|uniref:tandem-95 repeat protein n=1 Tax=Pseudoalteromonas rhizosphaerae TaxID=2518973 RepID=UPI0012314FBF|nr:Ig-like domain-containing protein [Pseudoalteromonas rhizosphaerae]
MQLNKITQSLHLLGVSVALAVSANSWAQSTIDYTSVNTGGAVDNHTATVGLSTSTDFTIDWGTGLQGSNEYTDEKVIASNAAMLPYSTADGNAFNDSTGGFQLTATNFFAIKSMNLGRRATGNDLNNNSFTVTGYRGGVAVASDELIWSTFGSSELEVFTQGAGTWESNDVDWSNLDKIVVSWATVSNGSGGVNGSADFQEIAVLNMVVDDPTVSDSTAPTLSEITAVTTPTSDNTPNYVFSTDEAGTLSMGGSCGTSTSTTISSTGNQIITLTQTDNSSALTDGTYNNCTVTVTDAASNASSALSIPSFTVDTTAPTVAEVTAVITPSNDTTPNYTFSTTETGTLSVGGSCGTSSSTTISSTGNQTITLTATDNSSALSAGTYSDCTITVTDAAGNSNTPITITAFTIDTTAPIFDDASSTPNDNDSNVTASNNIAIDFSKNIALGSGNITIRNVTDSSNFEVFDVALVSDGTTTSPGAGRIGITNDKIYINPTTDLSGNRDYAIRIDATAVDDNAGNSFAGIGDDTTFNFTTANTQPVVDLNSGTGGNDNSLSFSEGSGAVNIASNAVVTESDSDTITTITVNLGNDQDGASEGLSVSATAQNALTGISGASDITLQDAISITGATASAAEVATFLQNITYNNTSNTPDETARTVTVVINDGNDNSTVRTATVFVSNVTAASSSATAFNTTNGTNLSPSITFTSENETLTIANTSHVTGSTADGGGGTDTLSVVSGVDLTGLTSLANFETLTPYNNGSLTLSETQHDSFTTINGTGTNQFTIASADGDQTLTGDADIETYVLGAAMAFTLGSAAQNVTGSSADDTVNINAFTVTGTLNGAAGTDILQAGTGADLSGATISAFESLTLASGASVTMTEAQHDSFTTFTAPGTETITISSATDGLTGNSAIETYVLSAPNAFTLGAAGQNFTGSTGDDTLNIGSVSATGILAGNTGTDTLSIGSGGSISGATISGFENLTVASGGSASIAASQLGLFSGTVSGSGNETLDILGDGNFATVSAIESYTLNDDSTNARTVSISAAGHSVTASSVTDAITFDIGTLAYTGTITGENSVADTLSMSSGANISNATISNVSNLTLASGASVSMTASQHSSFTGTITAPGSETITITGDGDFTTLTGIESYAVADDSTNTRTITVSTGTTNVTAGSSTDAIIFAIGNSAYTGTLIGENSVADQVQVTDGADISGGGFLNIGTLSLASGATVAIDAANIGNFSTAITGSAGTETLKLMDGGAFDFTSTSVSAVEGVAIGTDNNATITLTDNFNANGQAVSVSNASGGEITAALSINASAFASDMLTITASNFNGDDTIVGGSGADTIRPGGGTDSMTGNAGNDNFVGSASQLSGDTITDLAVGDTLTITGVTGLSSANVRFNGTSTLEVDTDATDFNISELTLSLSNSPGSSLAFSVAESGSDTIITFVEPNSAPVFSSLNGGATFIENGSAIVIDSDVTIADTELDALNGAIGNYNNASLTISRNGGASTEDVFANNNLLGALIEGNTFTYNSTTVGTVTTNSSGTLVLTFNANATSAIVDSVLQSITYQNSSESPSSVTLDYVFNDGIANSAGTNQAIVNITGQNDAPTDISLSSASINQSSTGPGANIGALTTSDVDTTDSHSYTFVSSGASVNGTCSADTNNSSFQISGTLIQTQAALSAGSYIVCVQSNDATTTFQKAFTITVNDNVAPSAPSTPDLNAAADSGLSTTDNITNDTTPTFSGTAESGSTVSLYSDQVGAGATVIGSGIATDGNWQITTSTLTAGLDHAISAKATDSASNVSSSSSALTVTIDTIAPSAPSAADLTAASDSGSSSTDNITNNTTPTFTGTGTTGDTITLISSVDGSIGSTVVSGGVWSITVGSAMTSGSHTIVARATDTAGNITNGTSTTITIDTNVSAPSITTPIEVDGRINAVEDAHVLIQGSGADSGATVNVTISDGSNNLSRTVTADGSGAWTISGSEFDVSSFNNGTLTVSATQSDAAGNTSSAASTAVILDNAAPNALTIATPIEVDGRINAVEDDSVLITGSGAEANASVSVTISDGGNNQSRTVTADGSGAWTISGSEFDVSSFNNGTLTVSAAQSDAAGNTSSAASTAVILDNAAPNALTIATPIEVDGRINAEEDDSVLITGSGAEANASVSVTISDGANNQSRTVTADGAGIWTISGSEFDVSSFNNGTLTVSATQSDAAGNTSSATSTAVILDNTAPNSPTIATPIEGDGKVNAAEDSDVVITGSGAEANASVSVTISDGANNLSRTVTADGSGAWTISGSEFDVSSFNDGTLTVSATQSDSAGNTSSAASTSVILDNAAPSALTIATPIEVDGRINAVEDDSVLITGSGAEANASVSVTISDGSNNQSRTVTADGSGAWTISGSEFDVSSFNDGTLTVSATQSDTAGNTSSAASTSVILDNAAPNALTITTPIEVDGRINAVEDDSVLITGSGAEANASVSVTISDGANNQSRTVTADGSGAWTISGSEFDVSSFNNGTLTVSATQSDAAGNTSSAASTSVILDNAAPNALTIATPIEVDGRINAVEDGSVLITGSGAEANASVSVTISDGANNLSRTVTADGSGAWTISGSEFDVSSFNNGTLTVSATQSDAAGNTSTTATAVITLDNQAPNALTITTPIEGDGKVNAVEDNDVLVQGSGAESGATVTVNVDGISKTTTADSSGNWTLSGNELDISALNNGTLTVLATQTDSAGNVSIAATTTITLDNQAPNAPTFITPIEEDGKVNAAEDNDVLVQGGGAESGATVTVSIGGVTKTTTADSSGNWTLSGNELDISALNNGILTVSATQTDDAGNISTAASTSITLDNIAPNAVAITTPIAVDGIVNAAEDNAVLITGSGAEAGATVTVGISGVNATVIADSSGNWTLNGSELDISALNNGTLTVSATQTDSAGNISSAATTTITLDNVAPNALAITTPIAVDGIVNAAEDNALLIVGSGAESGAAVKVDVGGVNATVTADSNGSWTLSGNELDISALNNGTLTVSATQTDSAGNISPAATTTITLDNSAPPVVTINTPIEVDGIVNASEDDSVLITGSGAESGAAVKVDIGGVNATVTAGSGGNWTLSGSELDISALNNGTLTVSVTQTDTAGNTSPAATSSITLDNTTPTGHAVSVDQSLINADNESAMSVSFTGLEGSGSLSYQISDGSNSVTGNATISAVTQQITGIDVTTLAEGVLTFSAIVTDTAGNASAAVTATVTKKYNVVPVLSGSPSTTTAEDAAYSFIPTLTDSDTQDTHTFSIINKPSWASFDTSTGELAGTPQNEDVGSYAAITISVNDGTDSASLTPFTLEVTNTNDAPVGQNFAFNLDEAATLTVALANGLLSNASDDDAGDTLSAELVSQPQFGSVSLNSDGSFSYQHDGSENHGDSFTFQVRDSAGALSAVQTVTLTVTPVADAPVAMDDSATTAEDTPVNFSLVANDSDAENDLVVASAAIVLPASKGTVSITNGIATYTPNSNVTGTDTFTYTVKDAALNTSTAATVTVTITPVNDLPEVQAISLSVDEDTASAVTNVRSLASDVEDTIPTGTINLVRAPSSGQVVFDQAAGTFVYTPDANVTGQDSFTYTITDSEGGVSLPGTVTVNIGAVNDRPVVANDAVTTDEDTATTLAILANDSDVEDSGFNAANVSLENQGTGAGMYDFATVSVNLDGSLAIVPSQDVNGVFSFTYTLTDSEGLSSTPATVTLTINAVNDAPVALDNTAQLQEEGSFEVNVLGNDSDVDIGDSLDVSSVTVVSAPSNGQTQVTATGAIIYTANADYYGDDSFTYTVKDSNGAVSNLATVTMTVNPVNDAPVAQTQTLSLDEDASLLITLLATDIENDSLTYRIDTDVAHGTLVQQSSDSWLYSAAADYNGSDSFTFVANDGALDSAPVSVNLTVNAVNDAPVASAEAVSVNEDTPLTINLAASDIEGDTLTYQISSQPQNGRVTLTGSQAIYQGESDFFGTDSFSFVANDGSVDSAPAVITVTVSSVNDVPVISGSPTVSVSEKIVYSFAPTATDTEGDNLTFSISNKPSWLGFDSSTGLLSGTAGNSDVGVYSNIVISVSDGMDTVSLPAFSLTVINVNDAPTIGGAPTLNVDQDTLYRFTPTASDIDGDSLTFSISNKPSWANFDSSTGQLSGTPSNDDVGVNNNIIISVSDGAITTALSSFNLTVKNVNDAPTISGTPNTTVSEDSQYQFTPLVRDIDGDSLSFSIINKPSWASFDTSTGELAGTPQNEDVGSYAAITISVNDGTDSASLTPFTLEVTNTNDAPVGQNFAFNLDEAATLTVALANGLLSNASDDDAGDTLSAELVSQPQFGSVSLNSDGSFSYQHDGSENHGDSFTFQVRDSAGALSAVQTVTLTVTPVADAPVAMDDSATTAEDTPVNFSLVANDSDAENDLVVASAAIVLPASKGTVSITNGIATYTPNSNVTGTDTFTYTVKDAALNTSTAATVTVTITPVNDLPEVQAISLSVDEDTASAVTNVRSLASDVEDTIPTGTINLVRAPSSGQVVFDQAAGTFVYTPDANVTGQDSFTYTITDSEGGVSLPGTVTVNIGAVNDRPVVANDAVTTDEDTATTLAILANDSDVEDSGFNAANVSLENQGTGAGMYDFATVSVNLDGSLAIVPSQDVNGVFSFTYTLTDSEGLSSTPATVTLTINAVNDAPVALDNTAQLQEEGSFEVNVLGNDSDVDIGDSLDVSSVTVVSAPSNGQTQVTATGAIIYTANADYYGDDSFTYTVKDSNGAVSNLATVTMTVNPVNDAPLGIPQSLILAEDNSVLITLVGSDIENDDLSYRLDEGALHGSLVQQSNDSWLYTPNANYNGSDGFSFVVNDGLLDSTITPVSLVITAVNDAPVVGLQTGVTDEDMPVVMNLLGSDVDGDTLIYTIVSQPTHGTATISGEQVTYQGSANYFGDDQFSYIANDGLLDSAPSTVSVTINSINDLPVITGVPSLAVNENDLYSFVPLATDNDGDNLSFSIENKPSWLNFDTTTGELSGRPSNADVGSYAGITVSVTDGVASQSLTPFTLTVVNVNDAPTISGSPATSIAQDTGYSFTPIVSDIDNTSLSLTISNKPSWATFDSTSGTLSGIPTRDDVGLYSNILITVSDGQLSSTLNPFSIDVTYVNASPVANDMVMRVKEDNNLSVSAQVSDSDNDNLVIEVVTQPQFGSLTVQGTVFSYQPQADYHGSDTFSYLVTDGKASSAVATALITVESVNDQPVAVEDTFDLARTESGRYILDVLANDTDVDGDVITIIGARASVGTVSIVDQQLVYQFSASTQGTIKVEYIIADPAQAQSTGFAYINFTDSQADAPTITPPAAVNVDATGLFTRVKLGTALAFDSEQNPLPVTTINQSMLFTPGVHQVYWQATDSSGKTTMASQQVMVHPQISLGKNKVVAEDQSYTTRVYLNGPAASYPITVPYSVSGTATSDDHDLISGEVVIEQGLVGEINFRVFADSEVEADETIVITLDDNLNTGAQASNIMTISESNIAPSLVTKTEQNDQPRPFVLASDDLVTITALATDNNPGDNISFSWQAADERIVDLGNAADTFVFSTAELDIGIYEIAVTATDDAVDSLSTTVTSYVEVVAQLPELTTADTDNDLIPDNIEGLQDNDRDGIPDYLDNINECNVLPEQVNESAQFLVEGDAGACLRKAFSSIQNSSGAAQLFESELPADVGMENSGGYFSFIVTAMEQKGENYHIVLPQRMPIPAGAIYRKLINNEWIDFNTSNGDKLYSTQGEQGYCPSPNSQLWQEGLKEGDWCVQLRITDGGINDADGVANGQIVDPGGVSVMSSNNSAPVTQSDQVTIALGNSIVIDVLSNDSDADNDVLTLTSASVDFGEVAIVNNQLSYQPLLDFIGTATINYSVSDGKGGTAFGTATVSVVVNSAPTTIADTASTNDRTQIVIDVLSNDSDADGDALSLISAQATQGTVTINNDGTLNYQPKAGFEGVDFIQYTVSDSKGAEAKGEVKVTVKAYTTTTVKNSSSGSLGSTMVLLMIGLVFIRRQSKLTPWALLATAAVVSQPVLADEWSMDGTIGYAAVAGSTTTNQSVELANTEYDDTDISWSIGAIYSLATNWQFGVRYINLGEGSMTFVGDTLDPSNAQLNVSQTVPVLSQGPAIQTAYVFPLLGQVKSKVFVGAFHYHYSIDSRSSTGQKITYSDTNTRPYFGGQLAYPVLDNTDVSINYSHYKLRENDVNEWALGFQYQF